MNSLGKNLPIQFPILISVDEVYKIQQHINLKKFEFDEKSKEFIIHLYGKFHYFKTENEAQEFLDEQSINLNYCYYFLNQVYGEIIKIIQSNYHLINSKQMREFKTLQAAIDHCISRFTFYDCGSNDYYYKNIIFITEKLNSIIDLFHFHEKLSGQLFIIKKPLTSLISWDQEIKGKNLLLNKIDNQLIPEIKIRKRRRKFRKAKRTGQPLHEIITKKHKKKTEVASDPLIDGFISYLKNIKRRSTHTTVSYRLTLFRFKDFMGMQGIQLTEAKPKNITLFLREQAGRNISGKTLNLYRYAISSFYKYCGVNNLVKSNPTKILYKAKQAKKTPYYLRIPLVNEILDNIPVIDQYVLRDKIVLEVLYGCGIRVDELIHLEIKNINFAKSELKVLGKGNKERIVPIPMITLKLIKNYIDVWNHKTKFLIESDNHAKSYPMMIYRIVKHFLKTFPHAVRHTYATALLTNGCKDLIAIKDLLGHSSLAATQIYTHVDTNKLKSVHEFGHPKR